jgi:hypothetical protein
MPSKPRKARRPPVKFVRQYTTLLGATYRVYESRDGRTVEIRTALAFAKTPSWLMNEAKGEAGRLLYGGDW